MLEYDWENSVGHWVCNAAQGIRKQMGAKLLREGITFRQWEVLACLSASGGCGSQSELAEGLGIEPHTMAGVVFRMQRDGLLDRRSCEQDRRKNKVKPTAKADELWKCVAPVAKAVREQAIRGFSDEELILLRSFCERIQSNLESPFTYKAPIVPAAEVEIVQGHNGVTTSSADSYMVE
ncbi:MarR family winged helix-turn-helix transcriptional regulator [Planctomicrobium sp. SH527]|uniref:MarR family winged helix-turn-helix transcriptional regulator n=1 Tax=Planctomicrobium sp. SH527 TaxID=3448123 RepID=UPI003F5B36B5